RPEFVVAGGDESTQSSHNFGSRAFVYGMVVRVGTDPDEAVFRKRARGPSERRVFTEPLVGAVVKGVILVEERQEHIDVEKRPHQAPSSSISRCTCSKVMTCPVEGITGTPFRILVFLGEVRAGTSPFRAKLEITAPAVVFSFAAISLAAWRMSGSMSRV